MTRRPYKFLVTPVVQVLDDDGNVTGEAVLGADGGQPVAVFGCDALAQFAADFPQRLTEAAATGG